MERKIIAVAMCVLFVFSSCIVINAQEIGLDGSEIDSQYDVQPFMDFVNNTYTTLYISSEQANPTATIMGYPSITTKVTITMYLERKTWWWWSTVESWTQTFDGFTGSLSRTYPVSGGTYRVKAVYTAYSGSASEVITGYTVRLGINWNDNNEFNHKFIDLVDEVVYEINYFIYEH